MANLVTHFEVHVDDMERAKAFYRDVFGWVFKDLGKDFNDYVLVYPGGEVDAMASSGGINGGMLLRGGPAADEKAAPNGYVCTIAVDDIETLLKNAERHGATVEMPLGVVPGVGKLAYIRDSEKNLVGVIEPLAEMK